MKISKTLGLSFLIGILLFVFFYSAMPVDHLKVLIQGNGVVGAILFIFLMFSATVVAPVTVLPLVPFASVIFGPLETALYSIIGWWFGSIVAFLIARYGGKPLLERFVSFEEIEKYESKIPKGLTFGGLVLLRTIIPVDILSYVVGLLSTISLTSYALATIIGIAPFAFLLSYGGSSFFDANYIVFMAVIIVAVGIFGGAIFLLKRKHLK